MYKGVIARYKEFLPVTSKTPIVSLNEGNTPLIYAANLSQELNINLYFKYEGLNPTGSFKDRGMTLAVSKAKEQGAKAIICASTGNTSASAAAYAARAGLKCLVVLPKNKVAKGKLMQALVYGAKVIEVNGNFDQALELVQYAAKKFNITIVNSLNPYRIECQKTAAFELCDDLKKSPNYLFIPVGNAGNITAYWQGFKEYYQAQRINTLPKMMGYQAAGAAPIVENKLIKNPETIATAIRIGNPVSWQKAILARDESGGNINTVTDKEITTAYRKLAYTEGIFAEPGSCASFAGLLKAHAQKILKPQSTVVAVLTGHGLKDPQMAEMLNMKIASINACESDLKTFIERNL
ncbi:threonine synthase [Clostridium sp. 'deep sea']|uniref:threonine synthase n=1 Tax=Clostridium sp. 'deep sea' TaxID=2779445 RepID=UPI001A9C22C6